MFFFLILQFHFHLCLIGEGILVENGKEYFIKLDKDGNPIPGEYEFLYEEDGKLRLKIYDPEHPEKGGIQKELLELFGMRIPNQGFNSTALIEVVGFLPKNMGDLIIAPREFVTRMGSDFDIDKLYTYHFQYSISAGTEQQREELLQLYEFLAQDTDNRRAQSIFPELKKQLNRAKKERSKLRKALFTNKSDFIISELLRNRSLPDTLLNELDLNQVNDRDRVSIIDDYNQELVEFFKTLDIETLEKLNKGGYVNVYNGYNIETLIKELGLSGFKEGSEQWHQFSVIKSALTSFNTEVKSLDKDSAFKAIIDEMDAIIGDQKLVKELKSQMRPSITLYKGNDEMVYLKNAIVAIHQAVNANAKTAVQYQIHNPLDEWELGNIVSEISEAKDQEIDVFSPLSDDYQRNKYVSGTGGKGGVGIFSLDSVFNAQLQILQSNLESKYDAKNNYVYLVDFENEGKRKNVNFAGYKSNGSLVRERTLDGKNFISEVIEVVH
jgi:hypothetical protein